MCCRDVVTGAKVIGYLNVIGASLAFIILFIGLFMVPQLTEAVMDKLSPAEASGGMKEYVESMWWAILIVGMIISTISLIFASLLLNGIYNRKPSHILSYFIFGVVFNAIDTLMMLVLIVSQTSRSFTGVIHIVINSLWLWVVWRAYKKIKMEKQGVLYTNDMTGIANPMPPSYPYVAPTKDINTNF